MSKSKGNVIEPWTVLDRQGADAFRWYLLTAQSPWDSFRFSLEAVDEAMRRFLLTLWNTFSFLVTYAALPDGWSPADGAAEGARRPVDRWILSRLDGDGGGGHRAPRGLRRHRRRPGARGLPRRPLELVRAHVAAALLGRPGGRQRRRRRGRPPGRRRGLRDPARVPRDDDPDGGALLPLRGRGDVRDPGRGPRPRRPRERAPGRLARAAGPPRPRARGRDGGGPRGGGRGPGRARRGPAQGAPAAGRGGRGRAGRRWRASIEGLVDLVAEELNVRRVRLRHGPRRAGRGDREAQLPASRPALRQADAGRRRRGRRAAGRRVGAGASTPARASRSPSTATGSGWRPRTCCWRPGRARATPSVRTPPWRWASPPRSRPTCAARRWRARSSTPSRGRGGRRA